ncbi:DUF1206 domain-containing protein [Enemella dayhoffiae]|nr:DUF1206 domain-containing protein [Enemella dayhoffiae]
MNRLSGEQAHQAGSKVQQSSVYQALVTVGLICFGLVHILMGWICVQLAIGGGGGDASSKGALADLVSKPFGNVLVLVVGVGMLAMVVWQVLEAILGYTWLDGKDRLIKRAGSAGRAIAYAGLGVTALTLAAGGQSKDSNAGAKSATATLMGAPGGQLLVGLLAIVVLAIGISQVVKGIRRKFVEDDLDGSVPKWATRLGSVGWCAKGVAMALVGLLIGWSAITFDPGQAAGIDGALKKLGDQPFGVFLLILMAAGFVAFGVYCFVWSRNARHSMD